MRLREHFFGHFATKVAGPAPTHLRCGRLRGWIRRNKLPEDVSGGRCQSQSIQLGPLVPLRGGELPTAGRRHFAPRREESVGAELETLKTCCRDIRHPIQSPIDCTGIIEILQLAR